MLTAVTGGIAEGKTTVLSYLSELGCRTASADELARQVFNSLEIQKSLADLTDLAAPIDRGALRQRLFEDHALRRAVNRIMHPQIHEAILRSEAEFIEVPLLIEACLQGSFDSIWVVTCGHDEQVNRLQARYGENIDIGAILGAQLPSNAKVPYADEVIRTNSTSESVRRHVSEALERRNESS